MQFIMISVFVVVFACSSSVACTVGNVRLYIRAMRCRSSSGMLAGVVVVRDGCAACVVVIIIACCAVLKRETLVEGNVRNLLTGVSPLPFVGKWFGENVCSHLTGLAIVQDKSFVSASLVQPRNVDSVRPLKVLE